MLKAVIFDAYGTLFDTGTGSVDAARKMLAFRGREDIDERQFYSRWKELHRYHIDSRVDFVSEEEIFRRDAIVLYSEYGIAGTAADDVNIMLATLGKRKAYPEVPGVIAEISRYARVYIGSTTDTAPLMQDIARSGMRFDGIFTSESLRAYKPEAEFYQKILSEAEIYPEEALFVGDSLADDVAGPKQVGLKTCHIKRKFFRDSDIKPDYVINDMTQLVDIVHRLILQEGYLNENI